MVSLSLYEKLGVEELGLFGKRSCDKMLEFGELVYWSERINTAWRMYRGEN